ncbi:acetate/propionate family kinase [Candidatus Chloroploca sp. M-50]|uniref:Acetate kinase n=2 Tax=Candidatus Chloroploca mongolica TaxID=2528176 RepID=A0ABS4DB28_9CHLR|nr:acetate/propionate family kinase [Candidatus Chloroploca mongolica]MBP1466650.1 acetate/propionate family kinase [Candidatus Chloroploca mongolica]
MMSKAILVLNAGSSSIKCTIFDDVDTTLTVRYQGQIEGIGTQPHFKMTDQAGAVLLETTWANPPSGKGHAYALEQLAAWLDPHLPEAGLLGIGHRVVHGGARYSAPVLIDEVVLQDLHGFIPLAPLHQPANLAGIEATMAFLPGVPNVGCFDTAFHRTHSIEADRFALPYAFYDEGVRRYGFHGLSYEYIARTLPKLDPDLAQGRVVVAHLGNGASMCALKAGRSVDSTMGFTALDGLPMGTRCGQIDPGVLLYLMQARAMDASAIQDLLYKKSGFLGMSGVSSDMRNLEASADPRAAEAIDYFVYRIIRETGALASVLGGLDGIIFTAGIGENVYRIRERVCRGLAWLGLEFDPVANAHHGPRISTAASTVSAWVVPTNEERMIALHTIAALTDC